ncbi:MAG: hypothetical protein JKY49_00620 [Cohaesibacteraceae bacterium]|nr:hypothetical protein [Cohaesibacteraceae bacterium]
MRLIELHSRSIRSITLALILVVWPGYFTGAQAFEAASLIQLDPRIQQVMTSGSWLTDDDGGPYRLIVVRDDNTGTDRLFLEWLTFNLDSGKPERFSISQIMEFADLEARITQLTSDPGIDDIVFFIEAVDLENGNSESYELVATLPGNFNFGEASN